jgi:hypothetical protein
MKDSQGGPIPAFLQGEIFMATPWPHEGDLKISCFQPLHDKVSPTHGK